ncbi:hypothetical protein H5997_08055 [Megamonas hypermegale]|nr:hypothetical protein [Megamonas hypermegale]
MKYRLSGVSPKLGIPPYIYKLAVLVKFPANHKNIGFIAGSYSDFFNMVHMITPKTKENACTSLYFPTPKKERL